MNNNQNIEKDAIFTYSKPNAIQLTITYVKTNPFIAILILLILIGIPTFFITTSNKASQVETILQEDLYKYIKDTDIRDGKKDSPIKVVFFEDPQCPGCQSFNRSLEPRLESIKSKAEIIEKYTKIVPAHGYSKEASLIYWATEKKYQLGAELSTKVYADKDDLSKLNKSDILAAMQTLGINYDEVAKIANSTEAENNYSDDAKVLQVNIDPIDGFTKNKGRISGTPAVLIFKNGKLVKWSAPRDALVDSTFSLVDGEKLEVTIDELLK